MPDAVVVRRWTGKVATERAGLSPPLRGRKQILGFGEAKPLEFAGG